MKEEIVTSTSTPNNISVDGSVQLVTFELCNELYGFEVTGVQEVIKFDKLTPAPGSNAMIEGVIDLRGDIIPVIDLRKRFKLSSYDSYKDSKILIIEVNEYIFGVIVDKVDEVSTFPLSDFSPPPPGTNQIGSEYTIGVTHLKEQLLQYLDLEQVVNTKRIMEEIDG